MSAALLSEQGLAAMQTSRWLDAAQLYERAATAARDEGDPAMMKGCAVMAVQAYAGMGDGANALRVARTTVDHLRRGPGAAELPEFKRLAIMKLRKQGATAEAEQLSAYIDQPPAAPLPKFCSGCGAPVNPAEVARPSAGVASCSRCGNRLA